MMRTKARWTQRQNGSRVQAQNQNRRQGGHCAIAKVVHQVLQMQSEGHCQGVIQDLGALPGLQNFTRIRP